MNKLERFWRVWSAAWRPSARQRVPSIVATITLWNYPRKLLIQYSRERADEALAKVICHRKVIAFWKSIVGVLWFAPEVVKCTRCTARSDHTLIFKFVTFDGHDQSLCIPCFRIEEDIRDRQRSRATMLKT